MNDLLGGKDAGEGEAPAHLPKPKTGRLSAPRELSAGRRRSDCIWSRQADCKLITVSEAAKCNACEV